MLSSLLQEFQDVFPDELPPGLPPLRGIEHRIDLIPGVPLPNKAPYRVNPEETKEIQRHVQQLIDNGHVRESLSPCLFGVDAVGSLVWKRSTGDEVDSMLNASKRRETRR